MQDHIFRMYDIRGKVGSELYIHEVKALAHAIAFYYKQQDPSIQTISVGMDGRSHSPEIKEQLVQGLRESGLNVIFIGVCPSPVLYFSQYRLPVQAAVMITASHNPKEYNGFKICMHKQPVSGGAIQEILQVFKARKSFIANTPGIYKEQLMVPEYIKLLKRLFPHLVGIELPIVFDTGHGAVGAVLSDLIKAMQWKNTHTLCAQVDSNLATHEADPTADKNVQDLAQAVQKQKAQLGIGFDGDGDRMGAVTHEGHLLPGDRLLALFSKPLLRSLPGALIAFDIKCSSILNETIQKWGGRVHVSPSGHSFIKEAMRKHNAVLAGELSCHFFFNDRYFGFDDGIYAALRLLELLLHSQSTLAELLKEIPHRENSPELRIACGKTSGSAIVQAVKQKFLTEKDVKITTIDGVRVDTQDGWGLVRASNTQPVICIRFEAGTVDGLKRIREQFVQALEPCFEKEEIGKKITWPGI